MVVRILLPFFQDSQPSPKDTTSEPGLVRRNKNPQEGCCHGGSWHVPAVFAMCRENAWLPQLVLGAWRGCRNITILHHFRCLRTTLTTVWVEHTCHTTYGAPPEAAAGGHTMHLEESKLAPHACYGNGIAPLLSQRTGGCQL